MQAPYADFEDVSANNLELYYSYICLSRLNKLTLQSETCEVSEQERHSAQISSSMLTPSGESLSHFLEYASQEAKDFQERNGLLPCAVRRDVGGNHRHVPAVLHEGRNRTQAELPRQ